MRRTSICQSSLQFCVCSRHNGLDSTLITDGVPCQQNRELGTARMLASIQVREVIVEAAERAKLVEEKYARGRKEEDCQYKSATKM